MRATQILEWCSALDAACGYARRCSAQPASSSTSGRRLFEVGHPPSPLTTLTATRVYFHLM